MQHHWPTNPDASVGIRHVAALYDVSPKTIKRWVRIGRLPPSDEKKRYTWRAGAIIEFKRALELVRLVRRAARGQHLPKSGNNRTSLTEAEKEASQKKKRD